MPNHGGPDRRTASSPVLAPKQAPPPPPQASEQLAVQQMKLKVLYTFDNENKTNCLARWPQVLSVRTAYIDESTQIGVIELKTCLQAIVAASPEIVAKLGHDYTVYAYDYSEYETPLVGQGMLSWALASSSSTPAAPAHQSKTLVTGRVCKTLGLFSSSSQETLEVKLRLVPVPTCLQSEYIESMNKYRDISKVMPEGFDAGAWTAFLQANPGILQSANQSRSHTPSQGAWQREGVGIEHVQRLLNQGPVSTSVNTQEQPPRVSSPAMSVSSATGPKRRGRPPKGNPRSRPKPSTTQNASTSQAGTEGGYASTDDRAEEGPSKKRAKITKAEVPNKGSLGHHPESLRVTASNAASLRIHQPTAIRPPTKEAHALEAPPRAPTPIGDSIAHIRRPPLITARSSLRRESLVAEEAPYESPYAPSETGMKPPESAMTSPEASRDGSLGDTPADISSSPPVYHAASTAPSSPRLPVLPRNVDSGFMSGSPDDLFDDEELRPLDEEDLELAAQYCKRPGLGSPPAQIAEAPRQPSTDNDPPVTLADKKVAVSRKSARNAVGLGRTASSGALPRPSAPANIVNRPSGLNRSQSWAGHQHPHLGSDLPASDDSVAPVQSRIRDRSDSGSGVQRKMKIQSKLTSSIAAGEMPPFCDNCGAIETPTWRKAWVRIHSGTPEHVRISDQAGGILTWQTLQTDEKGIVCLYRIFKKSLLSSDEGFSEILLCNPCGLWLHQRKCIRPKETWDQQSKGNPDRKRERKRKPTTGKQQSQSAQGQPGDDAAQSSGGQQSDASSPITGAGYDDHSRMSPQLPTFKKPRSLSVQLSPHSKEKHGTDNASAATALQRAIQSSPARLTGVQHAPMLATDLTPRPTRRLLFPSPDQNRGDKLDLAFGSPVGSMKKSTKSDPPKKIIDADDDQADKENCPPAYDRNEELGNLFDEEPRSHSRPVTPTPTDRSQDHTFKTPGNSSTPHHASPGTGDFFSSTAKALLHHPTTPKRATSTSAAQPLGEVTPFTAHLNQLFSENNDSPPGHFDFPSLPSLPNTPWRAYNQYDFTQFDSQDFLSTDVPMPSSPPVWFGVYEDPIDQESGGIFSDYPLPQMDSSPLKAAADGANAS